MTDLKTSVDSNIYKDSENWESILDLMKTKKTMIEILDLLKETYPGFVVGFMDGYSPEYPHLTEEWEKIVKDIGVKRTQVMIIDNVIFDENHKLVKNFCECFTRAGFSVKMKMEFIPCSNTGLAVPSELLYHIYKKSNRIVPELYKPEVSRAASI